MDGAAQVAVWWCGARRATSGEVRKGETLSRAKRKRIVTTLQKNMREHKQ